MYNGILLSHKKECMWMRWMNLEPVIQSEVSQKEKDKYRILMHKYGIKIAGRNINHLRYADDTTLMAESEEELKSLLMKVKEESEKLA